MVQLYLQTGLMDIQIFSPHLYETSEELGQYSTLSHCWGDKQVITTTTMTLESRKRLISWNELSKTFQDAMMITQRLGLQHIWIDSLCIVQDDKLDWETESKKMATIYENSLLTIAAAKAMNGTEGCFSERQNAINITPRNTT